jgi:diaminohydroxyphosphoribosylaminopyrimidine deaminase/5-amino-6-(5-phosphoribosylamino)uracil reductase
MLLAAELAAGTPDPRPNPRVGCVLLDDADQVISSGVHVGAGQSHAEVMALIQAGHRAVGATAVVTLEPCNHHGRTGPCSEALISAGVKRVVFGQADPNPTATGGADRLRAAGVVVQAADSTAAQALNPYWTFAMRSSRPYVIWKVASTLDGRIAALDGSARWISGPQAREQTHVLRSEVDAVIVGTGTVLTDDPQLTARAHSGTADLIQPWRIVIGGRPVPVDARVRTALPREKFHHFATRNLTDVTHGLLERNVHYALLEGGAQLAAAFVAAGLISEIRWYVAPKLLGSGSPALADIGVTNIADAQEWQVQGLTRVGEDVRFDLRRRVVADTPSLTPKMASNRADAGVRLAPTLRSVNADVAERGDTMESQPTIEAE